MDVNRLLETRAREILCEAILKGMEAPSELESRAARDEAKKRALRAEAALDGTIKRWEEIKQQLENYKVVIDPVKAAASRELDEQRAALRVQVAGLRQVLEDHGIEREEFAKKVAESDAIDAEIGVLMRKLEGGVAKWAIMSAPKKKEEEPSEDVEMQ